MVASKKRSGSAVASAASKTSQKKTKLLEKNDDKIKLITFDEIKKYQKEILQSSKHYNNIAILLNQYKTVIDAYTSGKEIDNLFPVSRALALALFKTFDSLIKDNQLRLHRSLSDQAKTIVKWLQSKYSEFKKNLIAIFAIDNEDATEQQQEELDSLKLDNLDILMKCLYIESEFMGPNEKEPYFATNTYAEIVKILVLSGSESQISKIDGTLENPLVLEFYDLYFKRYWDIKYYFFAELKQLLDNKADYSSSELRVLYSNVLTIMKPSSLYDASTFNKSSTKNYVPNPPTKTITNQNQFKQNFEKSWLSLISLPLFTAQTKSILLILHKRIIAFFNNPTKLMDFLTESYDLGFESKDISISILALNGLWELMKTYNLEYEDFYTKLYGILTPDLLHLNYRNRFFRLLDLFLTSTHLPSNIVASVIKKLSKLSLTAPPAGIVIVIPFIYNLLKRHPTCMLLLQTTESPLNDADYVDPFDNNEKDPLKTNAMGSSIWELESMIQHYHPNVSSLAKIFTQPFNKYNYNMEDFLDWSYSKLLDSETSKKFKGELAVEYEKWDNMFGEENSYLTGYQL